MISYDSETNEIETRIIESANKIFLRYGVDKATMGQIAREAGITRTSLNYYFRSKKHLIEKFSKNLENKILPTLNHLFNDKTMSLVGKVELFIDEYIDFITAHPMVPQFIVSEMHREPGWIIGYFKKMNLDYKKLTAQINREAASGAIRACSMENLVVNILGLCVFPILARPLLMELIFDNQDNKFTKFITARKAEVKRMMRIWLTVK